ncbi:hypothetical protein, partial [Eisenbergiella porci]|uniref:hypothetical protein n=1 Tax=Eisenbergiella porci TaxID=2652274 RepID=UPI003A8EE206
YKKGIKSTKKRSSCLYKDGRFFDAISYHFMLIRQAREEESAKALIAGIPNHKFSIIIFQHNPVCLKFIHFSPLIW